MFRYGEPILREIKQNMFLVYTRAGQRENIKSQANRIWEDRLNASASTVVTLPVIMLSAFPTVPQGSVSIQNR
jgi:hypothetical protein